MINRIVLVGRLTYDPELRKADTGNAIATFVLAVDNRQKDAEGNKTASFIRCVCFGQTADLMKKVTSKGDIIGVEGRLNQRSYVRQTDNQKITVWEVLCDSVQFIMTKKKEPSEEDAPVFDDINDDANKGDSGNLDSLDLPADDDFPF